LLRIRIALVQFSFSVLQQVQLGWVYGNLFVWVGRILGGSSSMIPVKARKFAFGRMFGVEIGLLGRNFLACTALLV
jgi:hypothetical protein